MTKEAAIKLAIDYQRKYNFNTFIDQNSPCQWYDDFEAVNGPVWTVEAALPPSNFEGSDTITYVISVDERKVTFIINSSGFIQHPHQKNDESFTDDELDELRDAGFDVIE